MADQADVEVRMSKKFFPVFLILLSLLWLVFDMGCKKSTNENNNNDPDSSNLEVFTQKVGAVICYTGWTFGEGLNNIMDNIKKLDEAGEPIQFGDYNENTGFWELRSLPMRNNRTLDADVRMHDLSGDPCKFYEEDQISKVEVRNGQIEGDRPIDFRFDATSVNGPENLEVNGELHVTYPTEVVDVSVGELSIKKEEQDGLPESGHLIFTIEDIQVTVEPTNSLVFSARFFFNGQFHTIEINMMLCPERLY